MPFVIDMPPRDTLAAADLMDDGVVDAIRAATDAGIAVTIRPVSWLELAAKAEVVAELPQAVKDIILEAANDGR